MGDLWSLMGGIFGGASGAGRGPLHSALGSNYNVGPFQADLLMRQGQQQQQSYANLAGQQNSYVNCYATTSVLPSTSLLWQALGAQNAIPAPRNYQREAEAELDALCPSLATPETPYREPWYLRWWLGFLYFLRRALQRRLP